MTGPCAWRHVISGPCVRFGTQTTRYGPSGRPHRDDYLPVGEWLAEQGLTHPPSQTEPEEPGMDQDPSPEPVYIAEVIQAFREHPELFMAADLPDPPEAA